MWMKQSQETNIPFDLRWEFPKQRLLLGPKIGQGAFGKVVRAKATGIADGEQVTTVAVKMLKVGADFTQKRALLEELKIFILLGKHLNIVNLLGAVTKFINRGELLVIVEYCSLGSIRDLIIRKKKRFVNQVNEDGILDKSIMTPIEDEEDASSSSSSVSNSDSKSSGVFTGPTSIDCASDSKSRSRLSSGQLTGESAITTYTYVTGNTSIHSSISGNAKAMENFEEEVDDSLLTSSDLLNFAFQCSRGMEYIATRKLVHRDLAARNVLVNSEKIVKICDFGLTQDQDYLYCRKGKRANALLPVRWMSPESIGQNAFSSKSDVWSFGVLLWEMFSLGLVPYPGVDMSDNFYQRLLNGYRLDKPKFAPNTIYDIMKNCWSLLPEDRPDFGQLAESLGSLIEDETREYYLILNEPYEEQNKQDPHYEKLGEILATSVVNGGELGDLEGITCNTDISFLKEEKNIIEDYDDDDIEMEESK